jgi:hypothetical protein
MMESKLYSGLGKLQLSNLCCFFRDPGDDSEQHLRNQTNNETKQKITK